MPNIRILEGEQALSAVELLKDTLKASNSYRKKTEFWYDLNPEEAGAFRKIEKERLAQGIVSLDTLPLSRRTRNALGRIGVETEMGLREVLERDGLLGIGVKSQAEIAAYYDRMGAE